MGVSQFQQSDHDDVLCLCDTTFEPLNLSRFLWQPCQQVESLEKDCTKLIWKEENVKGYVASYHLEESNFRLNLLVDPRNTRQGIGTLLLNEIEAEVRRQGGRHSQKYTDTSAALLDEHL